MEITNTQLNKIKELISQGNNKYANILAAKFLGVVTEEEARKILNDKYGICIKKSWNTEIT